MSSNTRVVPNRGGIINFSLPAASIVVLLVAALTAVLINSQSEEVALAAIAGVCVCVCMMTIPTFWLAVAFVVLIPFHALIAGLLGTVGANAQQAFAVWKDVLLLIGIVRCFRSNPNLNQLIEVNRWVLFWAGLLMLNYCAAFLRTPSIPTMLSLGLDLRFLAVMLFFMLLHLNEKQIVTLLRVMIWSSGLIALYGLIQYFWDYERLFPFIDESIGYVTDGQRRLYSYSLNVFDPAFASVIAILLLFSGAARSSIRASIWWLSLLVPCLLFTYTRSAYLGLLVALPTLYLIDRRKSKRIAVIGVVTACVIGGILISDSSAARNPGLAARLKTITSLNDESSLEHKQSMQRAIRLISEHPFGIGLGKDGPVEVRFAGADYGHYTENWVLHVSLQTGVFAAVAYLGMTVAVVWTLIRRRCLDTYTSFLLAGAMSVLAATTLAGLMIPIFNDLIPAVYTWILVGVALATCGVKQVNAPGLSGR